jgi:hypothetical protein
VSGKIGWRHRPLGLIPILVLYSRPRKYRP